MKILKYIEPITYILGIGAFILTLILNKGIETFKYFTFMASLLTFGLIFPLIRIIYIVIREAISKEDVYKNDTPIGYFILMIGNGFFYYLMLHLLKDYFLRFNILFWTIFILYSVLSLVLFYVIRNKKKDDTKLKFIKNQH